MFTDDIIGLRRIADYDSLFTVQGNLELGLGFEEKEYFTIPVTDKSTNKTNVEMTASVFSDIHPSPAKTRDIASCILTDIVFF